MSKKLPKLIVILGPTASGKTGLAIKLAKKFNGEIISADSRQVYREMDIATAKPTREETQKIPHHLVDIIRPDQKFNVAIYKKMAIEAIRNIRKRRKLPFLAGGTGLYIKAVVDNVNFPKIAPQQKLRRGLERKTEKELFSIYKKLDPEGAKKIDKKNKRRLIRAIEVCKVSEEPFWKQRGRDRSLFDVLQIGIKLPNAKLKERIKKRVEKMFKAGLEKEVKNLVKKYDWDIPAMQTIGYQEWKEYFEKEVNKDGVKRKIILHTIQFAKRQMTWFKHDKRIHWVKNYLQAQKLIKEFLL